MFIRGYVDVDARKHGCGEKKRGSINDTSSFRDSYRIQTYNLLIRSQMLYSVELTSRPLNLLLRLL